MIAQHAGVKLEDTGHICAHQHYMLSMLGRCRTGFLREAKRLQLSQQMTKRFVQALGKLFQSSPTLSRTKDEANLTLLKSKNRNDLYKANKYLQQHLKKIPTSAAQGCSTGARRLAFYAYERNFPKDTTTHTANYRSLRGQAKGNRIKVTGSLCALS
jgi:hypothetical protein